MIKMIIIIIIFINHYYYYYNSVCNYFYKDIYTFCLPFWPFFIIFIWIFNINLYGSVLQKGEKPVNLLNHFDLEKKKMTVKQKNLDCKNLWYIEDLNGNHILFDLILSYHILSYPIPSFRVTSSSILSYPIVSYFILSYCIVSFSSMSHLLPSQLSILGDIKLNMIEKL